MRWDPSPAPGPSPRPTLAGGCVHRKRAATRRGPGCCGPGKVGGLLPPLVPCRVGLGGALGEGRGVKSPSPGSTPGQSQSPCHSLQPLPSPERPPGCSGPKPKGSPGRLCLLSVGHSCQLPSLTPASPTAPAHLCLPPPGLNPTSAPSDLRPGVLVPVSGCTLILPDCVVSPWPQVQALNYT